MAIDNANLFRKIQEGDRRKDEFLATLSHELRNPLAAISNALQCMEVAADSPAIVDESRAILRRQIQYVVRLVDDLLDVSRITRGKIRLRKETVELRAIVERALDSVRSLVADRRQELIRFVARPRRPCERRSDPARASDRQPTQQCGEIHAAGRADSFADGGRRRASRNSHS